MKADTERMTADRRARLLAELDAAALAAAAQIARLIFTAPTDIDAQEAAQ